MRERLEAAVDARTNPDFVIIGRTVAEDANAVIRRGVAFAQAGADVVMNSLTGLTADQINRIAREIPVPLLGIGVPKTHLADTRMKVNIHPNMVSGAAMALCDAMLRELKENGEVTSRAAARAGHAQPRHERDHLQRAREAMARHAVAAADAGPHAPADARRLRTARRRSLLASARRPGIRRHAVRGGAGSSPATASAPIENSAFLVEGSTFTRVGAQGRGAGSRTAPRGWI